MATLVVLQPDQDGEDLAPVAAGAGGDVFPNDGKVVLYVKNVNVASRVVTVDSPNACSFGVINAAHDAIILVLAQNEEKMMGPFPTRQFNIGTTGNAGVSYDDETDITIRAQRI